MVSKEGADLLDRIVLVVEDEVLIRLVIADLIREAGFTVWEAANGDDARRLLQTTDRVSLVVTDFNMPGETDGLALARHVRANYPQIKLIFVSAEAVPGASEIVDAMFDKPLDPERLIQQVAALMQRNGSVPPSVECA